MVVMELPKEVSAHNRQQIETAVEGSRNTNSGSPKSKTLNLSTYKFHSIGDYIATIYQFGTIESYSTQVGELQHRTIKYRYLRSARAQIAKSLATIEAQERHMESINNQLDFEKTTEPVEHFSYILPQERYHISSNHTSPVHIVKFLQENKEDIAVKTTMVMKYRNEVFIKNDTIFQHNTCRINFTIYDLHRSQDIINPGYSHSDIMVLAREDALQKNSHCFWYAQVIKIFHLNASRRLLNGELTPEKVLDFLWVRWFGKDSTYKAGSKARRLDRIAFISEEDDTESFGLLDPALVLRTAHIIPAFAYGFAEESAFSNSELKDWNYYYVNLFVDRDILVHYLGEGIGHAFTTGNNPNPLDVQPEVTEPDEDSIDIEVGESQMEGHSGSGDTNDDAGMESDSSTDSELDETSDDDFDMIREDLDEGYDTT